MQLKTIIKGCIAGVIVALPKGVPGFAVIYETITNGFVPGLHIATAYMGIVMIASIGILCIPPVHSKKTMITKHPIFSGIVGVLAIALGVIIIRNSDQTLPATSLLHTVTEMMFPGGTFSWIGGCIILLLLLETITVIVVIFVKVHPPLFRENLFTKLTFFIGVMIGATAWYSASGGITRGIVWLGGSPQLHHINHVIGLLFVGIGIILIIQAIRKQRSKLT